MALCAQTWRKLRGSRASRPYGPHTSPVAATPPSGPSLDEDEIWHWWCQALVQISPKKTKEAALCEGLLGQQWCFL